MAVTTRQSRTVLIRACKGFGFAPVEKLITFILTFSYPSMKAIPFFLFVLLSYSTYSQQTATLDQSLSKAKEQHKKVIFFFSGSDWCGPCIKLKKDVFESPEFTSFTEANLVLLRADFPRLKKNQLPKEQQDKNDTLAEKYNPNGEFPLTVLLNQEGKILREWKGYQGNKEQFLAEIKAFR